MRRHNADTVIFSDSDCTMTLIDYERDFFLDVLVGGAESDRRGE